MNNWLRENLNLTNVFSIAVGLVGIGFYIRGEQLEHKSTQREINELRVEVQESKTAIKEIDSKANNSNAQWAALTIQITFLQQQLTELKEEVRLTRRAVQ